MQVEDKFDRHARFPAHLGVILAADGQARGIGSCGDAIEITLRLNGDTIENIGFWPDGCMHTMASGSALCVLARGLTMQAALKLQPEDVERELGGLDDDHRHCARLAVNTLGEAIADAYGKLMKKTDQEEIITDADL